MYMYMYTKNKQPGKWQPCVFDWVSWPSSVPVYESVVVDLLYLRSMYMCTCMELLFPGYIEYQ